MRADEQLIRARESSVISAVRTADGKLLRRGSFKCALKNEIALFVLLFSVAALVVIVILKESGAELRGIWLIDTAFTLVSMLTTASGIVWGILSVGRECTYEALETEFIVNGPGKKQQVFYYSDVYNVEFKELRRFGHLHRGFDITVHTSIKQVHYRCIFGDRRLDTSVTGTPFFFLAVNAGLMDEELYDDPDISQELDDAFRFILAEDDSDDEDDIKNSFF